MSNKINFNRRIIKAPMFVIDYAIAHEPVHLIDGNHTAEFWNSARAKVPMTERAKRWLKEHGQTLEHEV